MIEIEEIKMLMDIVGRHSAYGGNEGLPGFEEIYSEAKAKLILKLKQL